MNITRSIVDDGTKVTLTISAISEPLMDKLNETRYVKIEEGSPAGDNVPYTLEVRLGGTDLLQASGNNTEPMGGMVLQINENGFQSVDPYELTGYGEQDRSTFISRVSALFDSFDGIVIPE